MNIKSFIKLIIFIIILSSSASNSFGHGKSESYSNWILSNNNITGIITIPSHEVTRLPMINERTSSLSSSFLKHAEENIFVYSQETSCLLGSSYILRSSDGFIRAELQYNCPQTLPTKINYRAIFELSPSHSHYAKIYHQGQLISERLISNASPPWEIDTSNTVKRNQSFISFFVLGMEHILSGYDHLAFLFGILLVAASIKRSIIAVTGFTIGHSASLFAATAGMVTTNSRIVEIVIGFTIMLMAVEYSNAKSNIKLLLTNSFTILLIWLGLVAFYFDKISIQNLICYLGLGIFSYSYLNLCKITYSHHIKNTSYLLLTMALLFGFVHGLGFAGFLSEAGMASESVLWPLLGFNLGLEFGQICIIFLCWIIYSKAEHFIEEPLPSILSGSLFGLGFFWFLTRTFT
tara:strand:+ start:5383 stop:6600 length:1218 start_codon:yes stop_codon:yes gene_type:complete